MSKPKHEVIKETLELLNQRYPEVFTEHVPLQLGIGKTLLPLADEWGISRIQIRKTVKSWTNSSRYLWHLAQPGAMRVDLDGKPVEPVTEEHRQTAIDTMKARKKARIQHKAKQDSARQKSQHTENTLTLGKEAA